QRGSQGEHGQTDHGHHGHRGSSAKGATAHGSPPDTRPNGTGTKPGVSEPCSMREILSRFSRRPDGSDSFHSQPLPVRRRYAPTAPSTEMNPSYTPPTATKCPSTGRPARVVYVPGRTSALRP